MKPRIIKPRLFFRADCELGEGPFWFENRIWWVDINVGRLHSLDAHGKDQKSYKIGRRIGAAAPINGRQFIVAAEDGIGIFDSVTDEMKILASPEKNIPGNRFNDGKCDPAGRFVAGTLNMNGQSEVCALYSFDSENNIKKILAPVTLSNGLAWNIDGTVMYFIDSTSRQIVSFAYNAETGELGTKNVVVKVPPEMGIPDGMDIDKEGNLWVAHWDGAAVRCWSPATGECLAEIVLPCSCPTSCCFGGSNFQSLFITTAQGDDAAKAADDLSGSLFVCEPGVTGLPVRNFSI